MSAVDVKDLMDSLPKSVVIVSQRPPLWRSMRERSCSALLCRSCLRPDIEGELPAMWPLLVK
jgi:hypothetical protein